MCSLNTCQEKNRSSENSFLVFILIREGNYRNLQIYIIRNPISLQKTLYSRSNGTIIYKAKYNAYWKENIKLFKAGNFIAELMQHIPPKHKHLNA